MQRNGLATTTNRFIELRNVSAVAILRRNETTNARRLCWSGEHRVATRGFNGSELGKLGVLDRLVPLEGTDDGIGDGEAAAAAAYDVKARGFQMGMRFK
jgi:hypothetical protein